MEKQKCIGSAYGCDDGDMVSFRGSRVQFHHPPLSRLHYHYACYLHLAHRCRNIQIVRSASLIRLHDLHPLISYM